MDNRRYTDSEFKLLRNDYLMDYLVKPIVKGFCSFIYSRVKVENGGNLPKEGPALLLPKHRSFLDPVIHGFALY